MASSCSGQLLGQPGFHLFTQPAIHQQADLLTGVLPASTDIANSGGCSPSRPRMEQYRWRRQLNFGQRGTLRPAFSTVAPAASLATTQRHVRSGQYSFQLGHPGPDPIHNETHHSRVSGCCPTNSTTPEVEFAEHGHQQLQPASRCARILTACLHSHGVSQYP